MKITFTEQAEIKVLDFLSKQESKTAQVLRITIPNVGAQGYNYQFFLDEKDNIQADDTLIQRKGFDIVMDHDTAKKMDGSEVDWVDSVEGAGFKVDNPNRPTVDQNLPVQERIQQVFDQEINPALAMHGGMVELLEVKGPRAFVRMSGGCQGCASSAATLKHGVENRIKEIAPEILEVVDTTDHAAGTNPYYSG